MRCILSIGSVLVLIATGVWADDLTPRVVRTQHATPDIVVALTELEAPPSEDTDAAPAIQAAVNAVADVGGGVVFLHAGRYRLDQPITIHEGVTLRGDWTAPPEVAGTILMPFSGRGDADGTPAITLERGSGIREVSVWYPEQDPQNIVPYPWTIRTCTDVMGNNHTVMNVTLVNPYQAFRTGPEWNELHTLRNVYATPLKTGIWIDFTTDIGRLIHVRFNPEIWTHSGLPNAPESEAVLAETLADAIGVDMGRSDWEYIYDVEVRGYGVGMRIRQGEQGGANAVMFSSRFLDCGTGLELVRMNNMGLAATGCEFHGIRGLHAVEAFNNVATFNASIFHGSEQAVQIDGDPAISFQNCTFTNAVSAASGSLSVLNSDFEGTADPHVTLGANMAHARILGNRFPGTPRIANETTNADVMIAHRDLDMVVPQTVDPDYSMPHPRPNSRHLEVVTDHGASPDLDCNAAAFQAALDAAAPTGGTVYVPAGNYPFHGEIRVPSGVELRGCFDVPHHTVSGGSVLVVLGGKGEADGAPFIELESGSGLRGLTFWYPEQRFEPDEIIPYPFAVRGLGPDCWLIDVTMAPAYQGVDFWTHPSDGHIVRYLAGSYLRKGIIVSKSDRAGWIEDCQFNPHYAFRLHDSLDGKPEDTPGQFWRFVDYAREHLEGFRFGRCADARLYRNFLFAAYDGISFRDDDGGTHGRVVMHGTDTGSRCLFLEKTDPRGIEFINTQLVPLGDWEIGAFISDPAFDGTAWFFNSQVWAGNTTGILEGNGTILLQQLNTISGEIHIEGGTNYIENTLFQLPLRPHITIGPETAYARLVSNAYRDGLFRAMPDEPLEPGIIYSRANSLSHRPDVVLDEPLEFEVDWTRAPLIPAQRENMGGITCEITREDTRSGRTALRIAGHPEDASQQAYAYFGLIEANVPVTSDTYLEYWIKPTNTAGRHVAIDLMFTDDSSLRDSPVQGAHPGTARGTVGEWTRIRHDIGRALAGKEVFFILVGFDSSSPGEFETFIDDVVIRSEGLGRAAQLSANPKGGQYEAPLSVTIDAPRRARVRYTLDGTTPTPDSPRYRGPITLHQPGLHELRFGLEDRRSGMLGLYFGELYDLE